MQPSLYRPPYTLGSFAGPETTIREMIRAVLSPRGEASMVVRTFTEEVTLDLQPKDYLSELLAIRNAIATQVRYANDQLTVEMVKDPQRIVEEILQRGRAMGDCDDVSCVIATMARQIGREAEFVTVGFGKPGVYAHVFARAKEPKSGRWIVLDPVAGTDEAKMLRRVTTWRAWRIQ